MAKEPLPPVDPSIRVPRAVRQAAEVADSVQKAVIGQSEGSVLAQTPPADPAKPVTPEVTVEPQPQPPQLQDPPQPLEDEGNWEHRYKTLHGRAEADRKRAREQMDTMTQRIQHLEQQLLTQAPTPRQEPVRLDVKPEEVADYGEDFIDLVKRIAASTVRGEIQPLAAEVGRTKAQVKATGNQSMFERMDRLLPNWQQLNQDERFVAWVQLPDPYSGAIRQRLLQDAWDTGDAHRVNAFFQGFLSEEAALNPQGAGRQPVPAPAAPPNGGAPAPAPQLTLAALAAPGGARSASPAPAEKPVYTPEYITRFYTEVAAGKWRGREQERAAIDADIMLAQHEGRITNHGRRYTPPQPPQGFTR